MRKLLLILICSGSLAGISACQSSSSKGKGIADSCYQPLYWPSEACPPGKK